MAAVSDQHVVRVLRPFVAATGPVLGGLRDADPLHLGRLAQRRALELAQGPIESAPSARGRRRRLARLRRLVRRGRNRFLDRLVTSRLPGTPRWQTMSPEERDRWWVGRVGRFTSAVASVPGIGGALARRLPVSEILGLAAQGLVLCAIAGEHGMTGRDDQVRLLAAVLFERDLEPARHGDPHAEEVEREAGELAGDAREPTSDTDRGDPSENRGRLAALARAVWRMGRTLFALETELDRRPRGRWWWRAAANLPIVGALASYRSERSGLTKAAHRAVAWIERHRPRPALPERR